MGVLTCALRIVAEIQIVGVGNVAWMGDVAMGVVFFIIGFAVGLGAFALAFNDAIKNRQRLEAELES